MSTFTLPVRMACDSGTLPIQTSVRVCICDQRQTSRTGYAPKRGQGRGEVEAETPAHPGESRRYTHNYYPDRNKDGTVVGVSCVVYDITERRERETGSRPHP